MANVESPPFHSRIKDIEDRLAAATPGLWRAEVGTKDGPPYSNVLDIYGFAIASEVTFQDAALIAHAPTDIRLLLDVAKAATEFREDCQHLRSGDSGKRMFAALDALENDV